MLDPVETGSPSLPESADTPLARLLHARGRLPLDVIQSTLSESRAARPGGPGLAARLIERGLLDAEEWYEDQRRVAEAARLLRADAQIDDPTGAASADALISLCDRQEARGEPRTFSRPELEALLERSAEGRRRLALRRAQGR